MHVPVRVPCAFRALAVAALALLLAACGSSRTPAPPTEPPGSSGTGVGSTVVPGGQGRLPIVNTIVTNLGPLLPTALEGVSAGGPVSGSGEEGLKALAVVEAAIISFNQRRIVELSELLPE